jgi:hypothetical protein
MIRSVALTNRVDHSSARAAMVYLHAGGQPGQLFVANLDRTARPRSEISYVPRLRFH